MHICAGRFCMSGTHSIAFFQVLSLPLLPLSPYFNRTIPAFCPVGCSENILPLESTKSIKRFAIRPGAVREIPARLKSIFTDRAFLVSILGGLIYLAVIHYAGYAHLNPESYTDRDDGLISYSHAVNLLKNGFIGVSPSGGRVEGYSTTGLFISHLLAASAGISYHKYTVLQTWAGIFLFGFLFVKLFGRRYMIGLALALPSAYLYCFADRFLQWHGAGLENALNEAVFLALLWAMLQYVKKETSAWLAPLLVFACFTRMENIIYIAPLCLLLLFYVLEGKPGVWLSGRVSKSLILQLFLAAGAVLLINIWRYWYFGSFEPNSSAAQDISIGYNIHRVLALDPEYLASCRDYFGQVAGYNLGWVWLAVLPLAVIGSPGINSRFVLSFAAVLTGMALVHVFVFHTGRLDICRYASHIGPVSVSAAFFIMADLKRENLLKILPVIPVVFIAFVFALYLNINSKNDLCCPAEGFDAIKQGFMNEAGKQQIYRPSISNPDLGWLSIDKQFNILDLGILGSPELGSMNKHFFLKKGYFLNLYAPDLIEAHADWIRGYDWLFADQDFAQLYEPVSRVFLPGADTNQLPAAGMYVRKAMKAGSGTPERKFYEHLEHLRATQAAGDEWLKALQAELGTIPVSARPEQLAYIVRNLFRYLPELRELGVTGDVLSVFNPYKAKPYAEIMLTAYKTRGWNKALVKYLILEQIRNRFNMPGLNSLADLSSPEAVVKGIEPKETNGFRFYIKDSTMVLIRPLEADTAYDTKFYVHVFPTDTAAMPTVLRKRGSTGADFKFDIFRVTIGDREMALVPLPAWPIDHLNIGQYDEKGAKWHGHLQLR